MNRISIVVYFILFIGCYSCFNKAVKLAETNAKDEVAVLSNLSFRFNTNIYPDSLLGKWSEEEFVTFHPAIKGRFRWKAADLLIFSPSEPLPPATNFTAKFTSEVLRYSTFDQVEGADELQFHTAVLRLEDSHVSWAIMDAAQAVPVLHLQFNHPVNPEQLKDKLQVQLENEPATWALVSANPTPRIQVKLLGVSMEDKLREVKVALSGKLVPEGGQLPIGKDVNSGLTLASPYQVDVLHVETRHDGVVASVQITTSQPIQPGNFKQFIKTDPALNWDYTTLDKGVLMSSPDADAEKVYELIIAKGLKGAIGGELKDTYTQKVGFGELEPSISFTNTKGMYLSKMGARNIEVSLVNVRKVKVVVSKIYENNLLAAQRNGYYPSTSHADNEEDYYGYGSSNLGDVVYEKEIDAASLPKHGNSRLFSLNLEDRIPDFKGIYHIQIRSAQDYWVSDSRFVALSDLGIIARAGTDAMKVFLQSIQTTQPIGEVQLTLYGQNNQVLGLGSTDKEGVGTINYIRKEPSGFRPALLVARTATDFNYLPLHATNVNTSRFEVGGKKMNRSGIDAFLYAERDMYRPGETFKYAMILRDQHWKIPGEIPVKLRFVMPNGKEWTSLRKNANAQGAIEGSLFIPEASITGTYTLEVYTGDDLLLTTYNFQVEEFVPDRLKVLVQSPAKELLPGQEMKLDLQADYFFGSPASDRNWETEIQLKQIGFRPKGYEKFSFHLDNQTMFFDNVVKEGKTDAHGAAQLSYTIPAEYKNRGLLQANFYATVFDEAGRPVSRHHRLPVYTQQTFIGVGVDEYGYYPLRQTVKFPLIALDKSEKILNGTSVVVRIIKKNYNTVLTKTGGYFRYQSQMEEMVKEEKTVSISGAQTMYSYVPVEAGSYELRVYLPGASTYTSRSFYSYGSWGIAGGSFEVNTDGNIEIAADKVSYAPGEKAKLLFKAPFDGRLLVTLENNGVLSHQFLQVEKRTAIYEFPVTATHLPNIYVTATLVKPHDVAEIPLTVAHGFQSLRIDEKDRRMPLAIEAAATTRSNKKQHIKVKATAGAMVSIAVVDNGILQVSDFKSPDPYDFFYQQRALQVQPYDIYPFLLPEIRQRTSSTGGDGDLAMEKRVNPITNKRFKLVSYWSGFKKASGSGEVQFEIDIPQFSGELRIMAVSFKDDRFGASSAVMKVADPLVVSTAMPRFLSPGDSLDLPVMIRNTTTSPAALSVQLTATGALAVSGTASKSGSVAGGKESSLRYRVVAGNQPGTAKVTVAVKGLGESFTEEIDITVRPASTLQTRSGNGVVTAGSTASIQMPVTDFMAGSDSYELVTGANPLLEFGLSLKNLLQYPYGCTEQTVAAAFPQLYYTELAAIMGNKKGVRSGVSGTTAANNVQEAIRKIKMRQLYNGAIMMWDNTGEEHWWTSVFAAHFLLEAGKAGYAVDQKLLEPLLSYLRFRLKNKQLINYTYNRDQQRKIVPKEVPYSLYVLSLAGTPQVASLNYYKAHPESLSLDGRYMLAAAFAAAGDKKRLHEIIPASFSGEVSEKQTGGSFYSPIRDEAMALMMLVEADPTHPQIQVLAKKVGSSLKNSSHLSTQESVFGILGLGKLAALTANTAIEGTILVNGKAVGSVGNTTQKFTEKQLQGTDIIIQAKGKGALYYYWQATGISSSGKYVEEDQSVRVRRQFYSRTGSPLTGNAFRQNELIVVALTVENMYKSAVENMVLTDLLPAGFEIENPRIREVPGMSWITQPSQPTALDIRDDRIHIFFDLKQSKQTFYYAVRAVSPGVFRMGPVSVEAMYDGAIHSYHGAGEVKVME